MDNNWLSWHRMAFPVMECGYPVWDDNGRLMSPKRLVIKMANMAADSKFINEVRDMWAEAVKQASKEPFTPIDFARNLESVIFPGDVLPLVDGKDDTE